MLPRKLICAVLIVGAFNFTSCAPKSNLDLLYSIIERSVDRITEQLPGSVNKFRFKFNSPGDFSSLENRVINYFQQKELIGGEAQDSNAYTLNYTIENININYPEAFREGFLGDYKVERDVSVSISFNLSNEDEILLSDVFTDAAKDSIKYSDIESVESHGLKFTQSEKPSAPFFDSLLEPVIAVSTLIVSIILLFTVRSK